jgi:hypothetical protein
MDSLSDRTETRDNKTLTIEIDIWNRQLRVPQKRPGFSGL